jgi:hypothetical protein
MENKAQLAREVLAELQAKMEHKVILVLKVGMALEEKLVPQEPVAWMAQRALTVRLVQAASLDKGEPLERLVLEV